MPDVITDTYPLSALIDNPDDLIEQVKATNRPVFLTVDGKPKIVMQDPAEYQRLLDIAALADAREGIRQGLAEATAGRGRPAKEAFDELREKYGIPR